LKGLAGWPARDGATSPQRTTLVREFALVAEIVFGTLWARVLAR